MSNVLDLKMHKKLKKWRRVSIRIRHSCISLIALLNEKNQALEQFPAEAIKDDDDRPIRQGQGRGIKMSS